MLTKLKHIIIGWYRKLANKETPESRRRLEICNKCENKIKLGKEYFCSICGCCIDALVRVEEESCHDGRW